MMAWTWGVSRLIDALQTIPSANIDADRLFFTTINMSLGLRLSLYNVVAAGGGARARDVNEKVPLVNPYPESPNGTYADLFSIPSSYK